MSEPVFVVSATGVVHVPRCSAAQRIDTPVAWTEETQAPGDRRCMLCFPAVRIGRRP